MDFGIAGKIAIVCGSTGGLGEATARALGGEGARVVVSGRRVEIAQQIASELPDAIGVEADLTAPDGIERLVGAANDAFGAADIVVLNGPGPRPGTAQDLSSDDLTAAMETLLLPHQRLVSLVQAHMREQKWGRILAVGSSGIVAPLANLAASNIGRAALAAYLKTLANEVARDGVTVNLLLPGRIDTDRVGQLDQARATREGRSVAEVAAASKATIPLGRYGRVEEFGATAAFLCSDRASYITGVALRCDGGLASFL